MAVHLRLPTVNCQRQYDAGLWGCPRTAGKMSVWHWRICSFLGTLGSDSWCQSGKTPPEGQTSALLPTPRSNQPNYRHRDRPTGSWIPHLHSPSPPLSQLCYMMLYRHAFIWRWENKTKREMLKILERIRRQQRTQCVSPAVVYLFQWLVRFVCVCVGGSIEEVSVSLSASCLVSVSIVTCLGLLSLVAGVPTKYKGFTVQTRR